MSREHVLFVLMVFGYGFIATLVSGLYRESLTHGRIGASTIAYGFPLSWLETVTIAYPGNPTRYSLSPLGLLIDLAFWSLIVGIPLAAVSRWLKPRK